MLAAGFRPTTDALRIRDCAVVVICVPTPLSAEGGPDLSAVKSAVHSIEDVLAPGALVILESTTWPGTTEEVVLPILASGGRKVGHDFFLAYSPERVDPGNALFGIENTPKIVGGVTPACLEKAAAFYRRFVAEVVIAKGTREAEMAKLLENTYRQINIALVNEMAKFSRELGIDIWNVIECAATKPFGFAKFTPGPGVGGHCIPIDPSYLSHRVQTQLGYPFRFVELAQEINRSMPKYVASRAQGMLNELGQSMRGARVLILGVTYKAGIADQRESPALPLARELIGQGAVLSFHDPYVARWELSDGASLDVVGDLAEAVNSSDLVIHLQAHPSYATDLFSAAGPPVLDTRGVLAGSRVERL